MKDPKESLPWQVKPELQWYHGSVPILAADGKEICRIRMRSEFNCAAVAEMIVAAVNAMHASGAIPLAVVLDGGLVHAIVSDERFQFNAAVIDYDTDGGPEEEITQIPQDNGTEADAFASFRGVHPDGQWAANALEAIREHDDLLDNTKH